MVLPAQRRGRDVGTESPQKSQAAGGRQLVRPLGAGRNKVEETYVGSGLAGPVNVYWVAGQRARPFPASLPRPGAPPHLCWSCPFCLPPHSPHYPSVQKLKQWGNRLSTRPNLALHPPSVWLVHWGQCEPRGSVTQGLVPVGWTDWNVPLPPCRFRGKLGLRPEAGTSSAWEPVPVGG